MSKLDKLRSKLRLRFLRWLNRDKDPDEPVDLPVELTDKALAILANVSGIDNYLKKQGKASLAKQFPDLDPADPGQAASMAQQILACESTEIDAIKDYFFGNGMDRTLMVEVMSQQLEKIWLD